jgi:hypothetical protein
MVATPHVVEEYLVPSLEGANLLPEEIPLGATLNHHKTKRNKKSRATMQ